MASIHKRNQRRNKRNPQRTIYNELRRTIAHLRKGVHDIACECSKQGLQNGFANQVADKCATLANESMAVAMKHDCYPEKVS